MDALLRSNGTASFSNMKSSKSTIREGVDSHDSFAPRRSACVMGEMLLLDSYRFGRFEVLPIERQMLVDGRPVAVGARAFDVLLALIERRDRVVSKGELLDLAWPGLVVEEGNLAVQVSGLRKIMGPHVVATVPGRGYRFAMRLDNAEDALPRPDTAPIALAALTNVPAATDALIGRDADVDELPHWIAEHRLVTLLGPGGMGKTRLAQAAAVAVAKAGAFADGVWWVDLGALSSADKIALSIAGAARLQLVEGNASAKLVAALLSREMLLVLDNCEQFADQVAALIRAVLRGAARVRILVTSQQALKVDGERLYLLSPLAVPPAGVSLATARSFGAVQLLEHRAKANDPRFSLTDSTLSQAIDLCRQLDGVPLSIEMAAARLSILGVAGLHARLGERLSLLRAASRGVSSRQQTLRATLDWSHGLLDANQQSVLRRLSVFAGNFRLEMAQRVVADDPIDEWGVLDALSTLVDKSLLQVSQQDPPRYRLLETARLYAAERMDEAGESDQMRERYGRAMAQLAETAVRHLDESSDAAWLSAYAGDYDDWQTAFEQACARRDSDVAAATGDVLGHADDARGVIAMFRARKSSAHPLLLLAKGRTHALLCELLASRSYIAIHEVPRRAAALGEVAAWRALEDHPRLYAALWRLACEYAIAGEWIDAERTANEARALEDPAWPPRTRLFGAASANDICSLRGDLAGYRVRGLAVLVLAQRAGCVSRAAWARLNLADHALMAGHVPDAIALGKVAVSEIRPLNLPVRLAWALSNLCAAHLMADELGPATFAAIEAWPYMWQNELGTELLNHVALLAARTGQPAVAALILGFAAAAYATNQDRAQPNEARLAALAAEAVDISLGPGELDAFRLQGAALSVAEVESLGRAVLEHAPVALNSKSD